MPIHDKSLFCVKFCSKSNISKNLPIGLDLAEKKQFEKVKENQGPWQNFSLANPLYWMINGLRYATIGITDTSHELSLSISIIFAIFFSILASFMFSKGYRIKT